MSLRENWNLLQRELQELSYSKVTIIAVSKTKPIELIQEALELGIKVFGENRIQEGIEKFLPLREAGKTFELHHIGPVQTGTLRKLFGLFQFTHGVGSVSSLQALSKQSEKSKQNLGFFLQANLTGETSKHGFDRQSLVKVLQEVSKYETEYLRFIGVMTMGPSNEDPILTRKVFQECNQIRKDYCPQAKLSMGMSGDYKIALEEGTDFIRIGSKIFGTR